MMTNVSIVIPTYNRANHVINAIQSCLNNDINLEVLVVDDGSSDNTKQSILDTFGQWQLANHANGFSLEKDSIRIRYIEQTNRGAPAARNNGLSHAQGSYVKFLDSDDLLVPGALAQEFEQAEIRSSDALLSGWILRTIDDQNKVISEQTVDAPDLSNGIDDMLEGKSPWTSAALYRRNSIAHLQWDEAIEKAQEWMWAWQLCLSGISFTHLDLASAYYNQHQSSTRITQLGNPLYRSTKWRLVILKKVEQRLRQDGLLNNARAQKLAQYYYKDARVLCMMDKSKWISLYDRIRQLDAKFMPDEKQPVANLLNRVFGLKNGVLIFVKIKNLINPVN